MSTQSTKSTKPAATGAAQADTEPTAIEQPGAAQADTEPTAIEQPGAAQAATAEQFTHRITAVPAKGFCRAGRRWYREATHVNRDDFSAEDWDALEAEPMLVVVSV